MAVRRLPPVKVRRRRKPLPVLPEPAKPAVESSEEPEVLEGTVQNRQASAPEERFARALDKIDSVDWYKFRYTVGAPRGLPGWKELDFLVSVRGIVYAIEVDSDFTHRGKAGRADVLHDAIVLAELRGQGLAVHPNVIHLHMEEELVDQRWADQTAKRLFL